MERKAGAAIAASAAALVLQALAPPAGAAPLFVCRTSSGRTLTADLPPAECVGSVIRQLNPDGTVLSTIEPPLTPEEKLAREAEERRRHEREVEAQTQLRKDRALLETYASEDEIEASRDRTLAVRQTLIERANQSLKEFKVDRKHLDDEAEFYVRRPMPDKLKRALADNDALQEQQLHAIEEIRNEMRHINDHYDAELRRFRELVMRGATPIARKTDP